MKDESKMTEYKVPNQEQLWRLECMMIEVKPTLWFQIREPITSFVSGH